VPQAPAPDSPRISAAAFGLLLLVTFWLPLPFGSVTGLGRLILESSAFTLLALALASSASAHALRPAAAPLLAMLALLILGVFQVVPLPSALLRRVSPESTRILSQASHVLGQEGKESSLPQTVSIARGDTHGALLEIAAFGALFVSSVLLNGTRRRRKVWVWTLVAAALFEVVYGVIGWIEGSDTILGTRISTGAVPRVRGTFVNPDHFAGYLEIALCAAFGLLYAEILTGAGRHRADARDLGARVEARLLPLALSVLLWITVFGGILLSQSRGGVLAAIAATLLLAVLAWLRRRRRGSRRTLVSLLGGAFALALLFSAGPVLDRFLGSDPREMSNDTRAQLRALSARVESRFPVFGTGLGTFRDAFVLVQPRNLVGVIDHAHNDFVELKVTGGWIGFLAGLAGLLAAFQGLAAARRRQPHRIESAFALAGIGALAALSIHALFDFNFVIPANPATLALMLGWAYAAAADTSPAMPL